VLPERRIYCGLTTSDGRAARGRTSTAQHTLSGSEAFRRLPHTTPSRNCKSSVRARGCPSLARLEQWVGVIRGVAGLTSHTIRRWFHDDRDPAYVPAGSVGSTSVPPTAVAVSRVVVVASAALILVGFQGVIRSRGGTSGA